MNPISQAASHPDDTDARQIIGFLRARPDFFSHHPELLAQLDIPHGSEGAVSLVERQIRILRGQVDKYRGQLAHVVEMARANDQLVQRMHSLTIALIETSSQAEVVNTLQDELRAQFKADSVALHTFADIPDGQGRALFGELLAAARPRCGQLVQAQLDFLFPNDDGTIGSVAMVPLRLGSEAGVLAIGSRDAQRFSPEHEVDFLHRLGEIVEASLIAQRHRAVA